MKARGDIDEKRRSEVRGLNMALRIVRRMRDNYEAEDVERVLDSAERQIRSRRDAISGWLRARPLPARKGGRRK